MKASDIIKRVQTKLDDPDGTYITDDYALAHIQGAYDDLYNELTLAGYQWDQQIALLPGVAAGTPDLSTYMVDGQPLAALVRPRMIEWKLAGIDDVNYRRADGPLDAVRDVPLGIPLLDSWAWLRSNIYLSRFSSAIDLRITGEFLFDPLKSTDDPVTILKTATQVLVYYTCESIGDARGNDKWSKKYGAKGDLQVDLLFIAMTKANQAKTRRVGRMSNRAVNSNPITFSH